MFYNPSTYAAILSASSDGLTFSRQVFIRLNMSGGPGALEEGGGGGVENIFGDLFDLPVGDLFDVPGGNIFGETGPDELELALSLFRPLGEGTILTGKGSGFLLRYFGPVFSLPLDTSIDVEYTETMDMGDGSESDEHTLSRRESFVLRHVASIVNTINKVGVSLDTMRIRVAMTIGLGGLMQNSQSVNMSMSAIARVTRRVDKTQFKDDYYGFIPTGSGGIGKSNKPPTLGSFTHSFTVTYGTLQVTLPAPQVNDTETQQTTRINRTSRGLTRKVYRDGNWFVLRLFDYRFTGLTLQLKNDFEELIRTAAGDKVNVIDHLGLGHVYYIGEVGSTIEYRNDQCSYIMSVVFQEVK